MLKDAGEALISVFQRNVYLGIICVALIIIVILAIVLFRLMKSRRRMEKACEVLEELARSASNIQKDAISQRQSILDSISAHDSGNIIRYDSVKETLDDLKNKIDSLKLRLEDYMLKAAEKTAENSTAVQEVIYTLEGLVEQFGEISSTIKAIVIKAVLTNTK